MLAIRFPHIGPACLCAFFFLNFGLLINAGCFHFSFFYFLWTWYINILNSTVSLLLLSLTELFSLVIFWSDCVMVALRPLINFAGGAPNSYTCTNECLYKYISYTLSQNTFFFWHLRNLSFQRAKYINTYIISWQDTPCAHIQCNQIMITGPCSCFQGLTAPAATGLSKTFY